MKHTDICGCNVTECKKVQTVPKLSTVAPYLVKKKLFWTFLVNSDFCHPKRSPEEQNK